MEDKEKITEQVNENVTEEVVETPQEATKTPVVEAEEVSTEATETEQSTETTKEVMAKESAVEEKTKKQPKIKKEKVKKEKVDKKKLKREEEIASYEGLSDDEIYTKIQTDKLLERKKNKRIATMAGMCVAFILAVCVIVMAIVPVSLKPVFMDSGFSSVKIYNGSITPADAYLEGSDEYKKFVKLYNKSFSQSYLTALFSGSIYTYKVEENKEATSKILGSAGELVTQGKSYVQLTFNKQVLKSQNGKIYKSEFKTDAWGDVNLTYENVYFVVNHESGFQNIEIYVVAAYPVIDKGEITDYEDRIITITVKADTSVIYNELF